MAKSGKTSKKLDELKNKIYSRNLKIDPKPRGEIHKSDHEIPNTWSDSDLSMPKKNRKPSLLKSSIFKKFFFGAIIFFLLSAGFGLFMFFGGSNTVSADNIDITVLGNAFASGGEELPLQIQISNRNNAPLRIADLLIEYQRGAGIGEDMYRQRIGIGDIPAGGVAKELLNVTLFGQQGSTRDINITLEYRVPDSNAIFVKQRTYTINISSAPVNLSVIGPENSGFNQNLSFSIKTSLNTPAAVKNMMVVANYPRGFDFKSAEPMPTFGDNIWVLGDLNPGVEREIKVNGTLVAQSGEQRAFNVYVGQQKDVNERQMGVQFNTQSYLVHIQKPFLDTRFLVNSGAAPEAVVASGGNVTGDIEWRNAMSTRITDVEITAEISGGIVDYSSITSSGFFESATNTIIWNKQNFPAFADVRPGQSGRLSFSFKTTPPTAAGSEAYVNISIKAREPSVNNEHQDIKNFERKVIRVATNMQFAGHTLYYGGALSNSGPLPPTSNQSTTYSIKWSLVNSLNDVGNAEVRGRLPIYVDWVGATSPAGESGSYNASTKEVIWNAGTVRKGAGTSLPPKEVEFQVRFNPSTIHIGNTMNLVENINFKGLDVLTNRSITGTYSPITHRLDRDLNYNFQNDKVQ